VVAVGNKQRDDDDIAGSEKVGDVVDFGFFVHEQRPDLREAVPFADAVGVVLDCLCGVRVPFCSVADDCHPEPLSNLGVTGDRLRALDDDVGHRGVGTNRTTVVDRLAGITGRERRRSRAQPLRVPGLGVPPLQTELPGNDLLGKVALTDKQRDDVDLLGGDGSERLAEVWLFLPEHLPNVVERARCSDAVAVGERGGARLWIAV
jgi:hypothetical protein